MQEVNQVMEEPESFKQPPEWMMNLVTASQKLTLDTYRPEEHRMLLRIYYPSRSSLEEPHP
ncbi:MAG: hypothetical protein R2751_16865 [Bacteroidales bacterium]